MKPSKAQLFKCIECKEETDFVLVDGYAIGDTLLEDVWFQGRLVNGKWQVTIDEDSRSYFDTLNTKLWLKEIRKYIADLDLASCPHCKHDIALDMDRV